MRIAIVTDAWEPQLNGVVNATRNLCATLEARGCHVLLITPDQFHSVPCPTYSEIRLALTVPSSVGAKIETFAPDAIHLMTEGPLCLAARRWCLKQGHAFTSAFCTNFPRYIEARTGLPERFIWPYFRWFHRPASGTLASTPSLCARLERECVAPVRSWGRGVDLQSFGPDIDPPDMFFDLPRPIQLYVGRVAVEKNIAAFLANRHPGSKVVVGDGPALASLRTRFPDAHFLGRQTGQALASCYAGADVLVFPSRTDTFGVVMIEALACGTPVAAFPVNGPLDVIRPGTGAFDDDLEKAIERALQCDRGDCARYGRSYTWAASAQQFLDALETLPVDLVA